MEFAASTESWHTISATKASDTWKETSAKSPKNPLWRKGVLPGNGASQK